MRENEDWVKEADNGPRFLRADNDLYALDNKGHKVEPDSSADTQVFQSFYPGRHYWHDTVIKYCEDLIAGLGDARPIFSDLVEVGVIRLSSWHRTNTYAKFRAFIFAGTVDYFGKHAEGFQVAAEGLRGMNQYLRESPFGSNDGLFKTISRQQTTYGMYSDHSFEYSMPISSINLEHYGNISKPLSAKIDPVYNFYCREYEGLLANVSDAGIPEYTLPNIYTLLTEKFSVKRDVDLPINITNFLRLNPTRTRRTPEGTHQSDGIQNFMVDKLNSRRNSKGDMITEKTGEASKGRSYFKKWATVARRMLTDRSFDSFKTNFGNYRTQVFPHNEDRLYLRLKAGKTSFPMLVDVNFSTDRTAPVADAIARTKLDCLLANHLLDKGRPGAPNDLTGRFSSTPAKFSIDDRSDYTQEDYLGFVEAQEFIIKGAPGTNSKVTSRLYPNSNVTGANTSGRKCYDFEEWIRSIGESGLTEQAMVIFGESDSSLLGGPSGFSGGTEMMALFRTYLAAKIKKMIKEEGKFRHLSQVFNGKMCYNEALCYKIEKYSFDENLREVLLAEYIVPNKSDTDEITFTDTQVKYDKPYFYRIKVVSLVIGNEYFYVFPPRGNGSYSFGGRSQAQRRTVLQNLHQCRLHYCNYPSVKIIETPYFNSQQDATLVTRVVDSPPVPPLVKVDVYKGVNSRILITANGGIGDYVDAPIMLNPSSDSDIIEKIRQSQATEMASLEKNDLTAEKLQKIRFRNDDIIDTFEIYRIANDPPMNYSDFQGKLHKSIYTYGKVNSGAFIDAILPNTKYYYAFRAIDVHGYFSNPTSIYSVEIRSNEGMIYPIIKTYYPGEDVDLKIPTKPFQKFLEVRPLDEHLTLNFEKSGLDGIKNMIQGEASKKNKISSLFPERVSEFKEGNQYVLGDDTSPSLVWGRKFKIRLTSRHSGRKLDLNVKFSYNDLVKASDFYTKDREN